MRLRSNRRALRRPITSTTSALNRGLPSPNRSLPAVSEISTPKFEVSYPSFRLRISADGTFVLAPTACYPCDRHVCAQTPQRIPPRNSKSGGTLAVDRHCKPPRKIGSILPKSRSGRFVKMSRLETTPIVCFLPLTPVSIRTVVPIRAKEIRTHFSRK